MGGTVTAVGAAAAAVVVMTVLGAVGGITVPMVVTVVVLVVVKVRLVGSIFSNLGQPARLGISPPVDNPHKQGAQRQLDLHAFHLAPTSARSQAASSSPATNLYLFSFSELTPRSGTLSPP